MNKGFRRRGPVMADALEVECWCQREVVLVPVDLVRQFQTLSCGAEDCRPLEAA